MFRSDVLIAEVDDYGNFHPTFEYSGGRVEFDPNAGLTIHGATRDESGVYSVHVYGEDGGPVALTGQRNVTVNRKNTQP